MMNMSFLALGLLLLLGITVGVIASTADEYYPGFHVRPSNSWMNDPNGPMRDPRSGIVHLWMQHNPFDVRIENMVWYHTASRDYVKWRRLGISLSNDTSYDGHGVWSGSTTQTSSGDFILLYTCVDEKTNEQKQCIARPVNSTDPWLMEWKKDETNPIIATVPDGGDFANFRDPTTAWSSQTGDMLFGVGASLKGRANVVVYNTSSDFQRRPSLVGSLFADPFDISGMFECPDFYKVSDTNIFALKTSNLGRDFYRVGAYDSATESFIPTHATEQHLFDYGLFYASKSFYDTISNRRIVWGWVVEDSPPPMIWAGVQSLPREIQWSSVYGKLLTPPLPELQQLRKATLPVHVAAGSIVPSNGSCVSLLPPGVAGLQSEFKLTVSFPASAMDGSRSDAAALVLRVRDSGDNTRFTEIAIEFPSANDTVYQRNTDFPGADLRFVASIGSTEELRILYCKTACDQEALCLAWTYERVGDYHCYLKTSLPTSNMNVNYVSGRVRRPMLVSRREHSASVGCTDPQFGACLLDTVASVTTVTLHVFIDHSVIEVFKDEGLEVVTSRVYIPSSVGGSDGYSLCGNVGGDITVVAANAFVVDDIWEN